MFTVKIQHPEGFWVDIKKEFLTLYNVVEYMMNPDELAPIFYFQEFCVLREDLSVVPTEILNQHLPKPEFEPPWLPLAGFNRGDWRQT
jgi:hypothetical protein